jgi:predicted transcriptional regulator
MGTDRQREALRLRATGLTQTAIAERLGVSQPAVSALLRGAEGRKRGERATSRKAVIKWGKSEYEPDGAWPKTRRCLSALYFLRS